MRFYIRGRILLYIYMLLIPYLFLLKYSATLQHPYGKAFIYRGLGCCTWCCTWCCTYPIFPKVQHLKSPGDLLRLSCLRVLTWLQIGCCTSLGVQKCLSATPTATPSATPTATPQINLNIAFIVFFILVCKICGIGFWAFVVPQHLIAFAVLILISAYSFGLVHIFPTDTFQYRDYLIILVFA